MEGIYIGDRVTYVDSEGKHHNGLVIHVWPTCINLVYVSVEDKDDSFGRERSYATSIPPLAEGMSGNYFMMSK